MPRKIPQANPKLNPTPIKLEQGLPRGEQPTVRLLDKTDHPAIVCDLEPQTITIADPGQPPGTASLVLTRGKKGPEWKLGEGETFWFSLPPVQP